MRDTAIATVALNNPEKLNALSFGMWHGKVMRKLEAGTEGNCCSAMPTGLCP
jgi:enoyl-CoA hydratase/carnithine racemase